MVDNVKVIITEKNGSELSFNEEYALIDNNVPFDNTGSGLISDNVGDAIREVETKITASASPGFSFGRGGNIPSGTWLYRVGSVPSNKTGVPIGISNPVLISIKVGNENISTFDVQIYEHEGDEINLTLLTTVSIVNTRTQSFTVSIPITTGRQLAAYISAGSGKNVGVDLQLSGTT